MFHRALREEPEASSMESFLYVFGILSLFFLITIIIYCIYKRKRKHSKPVEFEPQKYTPIFKKTTLETSEKDVEVVETNSENKHDIPEESPSVFESTKVAPCKTTLETSVANPPQ